MADRPAKQYRKMIEKAVDTGDWVYDGFDSAGHGLLRYVPTGETVAYGTHLESDKNAVRNVAKRIERISGVNVWDRSSRKPSRKKPHVSGYTPRKSRAEKSTSEQVEALYDELDEINEQLANSNPQRHRGRAIQLARRRLEIEEELVALYQPKERPQ